MKAGCLLPSGRARAKTKVTTFNSGKTQQRALFESRAQFLCILYSSCRQQGVYLNFHCNSKAEEPSARERCYDV